MSDDLEKSLRAMKGDPLPPRIFATRDERLSLIQAVGGPRTSRSIRAALRSYPKARIPFLFSSLEPQLVVDVLENDLDSLIQELLTAG